MSAAIVEVSGAAPLDLVEDARRTLQGFRTLRLLLGNSDLELTAQEVEELVLPFERALDGIFDNLERSLEQPRN